MEHAVVCDMNFITVSKFRYKFCTDSVSAPHPVVHSEKVWVSACSRVHVKLMFNQMEKKVQAFYGTQSFIAVFEVACYLSLS